MSVTVEIKLTGGAQSIFNLKKTSESLKQWYLEELYKSGVRIKDTAKAILRSRVNPLYSTGRLEKSIDVAFNPKIPAIRVGPDMRMAPYAEWVEFGHFMVSSWTGERVRWWPGHHYMADAFLTEKDNIINSFRSSLADELRHYQSIETPKGIRIRHLRTGRIVGGF